MINLQKIIIINVKINRQLIKKNKNKKKMIKNNKN